MQIPKIGLLELNTSSSPLRYYPIKPGKKTNEKPIDVSLGDDLSSRIQVQKHPAPLRKINHLPVRSKKTSQGQYQLGPFVAILTSDSRTPFAGNHKNFADLIQMGRQLGITVYVLTPKGIRAGKPFVNGYLLQKSKPRPQFQQKLLPFPSVVYNRIPYRNEERSNEVIQAIKHLKQKKVPIFNPYFFNKWSLYKDLSATPCQTHLPATAKLTDYTSFLQMMLQHTSLILKPIEGKAGIGMMKVEGNGPYTLTYQTKMQKQRLNISKLPQVYEQIKKRTKSRPYVLQQAIELATYQGSPFDIRMLVQKDGTADWKISGIGVRIAGQRAISTHVPMGGRIESLERVLVNTFPQQKKTLQQRLEQLGISFAKEIEEKTGKTLGEMSMDIGIDKFGKLWFFEANAKPQKFDEPTIRARSLRRILEYALYLSSFPSYRRRVVSE
ncbi:YheC/YheD family protein [Shimazuella sp. AN120528]|uniref:YheC/YheD family endospore coat-associated protein n=1 Tax=Shimazuella soli TaxID=1892854 RepID=UPI001F0EC593|nr:YheC/YheD family protein [Shimazuella soli]MCH5584331.1 YheC/YheD family protein [Shimazuella soli]